MRRKGLYYYRRRVPTDLVPVIGKPVIQYSLDTTSLQKAAKLRNLADVEWDARFEEAEKLLAEGDPEQLKPLTREEAIRLVQDYVARIDVERAERFAKHGPVTADDRREMKIDVGMSEQYLRDPEHPEYHMGISFGIQRILDGTDYSSEKFEADVPDFVEIVRRGLLELERRALARLRDDFSTLSFDHLFAPKGINSGVDQSPPFGRLCDQFFDIYQQEAAAKGIQQLRVDKVRAHLELVRVYRHGNHLTLPPHARPCAGGG
jgi:hypothetical protein